MLRVGHPDPGTFHAAFSVLAELHDALWQETGISPQRTVLGGFSMGTVMSYALALSGERPAVAGILAFSGFIPQVSGWSASFADRMGTRAFVAHGADDRVIDVSFGRAARDALTAGGLDVEYHEAALGHQVAPAHVVLAASWLAGRFAAAGP